MTPEITNYIEDRINKVYEQTDSSLHNIQISNCIRPFKPEVMTNKNYVVKDYEYKISLDNYPNGRIFKIFNLPLTPNTPMSFYGSAINDIKYAITYKEAVANKYVEPIIFMKKRYDYCCVIDWNYIWICKNGLDIYLIFENYSSEFTDNDLYGIILPDIARYINKEENPSYKPKPSSIVFNIDGYPVDIKYDKDNNIIEGFDRYSFGYDISSKYISYSEFGFDGGSSINRGFVMPMPNGCELFVDSIIIYKDGRIIENSNDCLKKIDSNTFIIKDDDTGESEYTFKVYYYTDTIESCNNIYHLDYRKRMIYLESKYDERIPEKFNPLYDPLDLNRDEFEIRYRKSEVGESGAIIYSDPEYLSSYTDSLHDKFEKILKYRKELLYPNRENTEYNRNNVSVYHITGREIMNNEDENGITTLNQKLWFKDNGEVGGTCKPVIFVNNKLYNKYYTLEMHNNGTYSFNSSFINRDDDVEIYYFGQTPNVHITNYKEYTIPSDTKTVSCDIDMRNALIFEKEPVPTQYDLSEVKTITMQYHIPFTATINENGTFTVVFEDESYYDKEVIIVPNTQFITFSDIAEEGEAVNIVLPESFKYAHNIDHYMVFINGKRISNDCLEFNIPKKDNPFYELSIYSSIIFAEGDRVDVLYLPFAMTEIVNENTIPDDAMVKMFRHEFPFGLNLENYLIFVNGMKVNNNEIEIVSDNTFKINNNICTIDNLSIVNIDIIPTQIDQLFNSDDWNDLVTELESSDLVTFYKDTIITEEIPNIRENETYKKAILLEIFRDYYGIHYEGVPLAYTTNEELLDEKYKDIDDNILVDAANARVILNIDYDKEG